MYRDRRFGVSGEGQVAKVKEVRRDQAESGEEFCSLSSRLNAFKDFNAFVQCDLSG